MLRDGRRRPMAARNARARPAGSAADHGSSPSGEHRDVEERELPVLGVDEAAEVFLAEESVDDQIAMGGDHVGVPGSRRRRRSPRVAAASVRASMLAAACRQAVAGKRDRAARCTADRTFGQRGQAERRPRPSTAQSRPPVSRWRATARTPASETASGVMSVTAERERNAYSNEVARTIAARMCAPPPPQAARSQRRERDRAAQSRERRAEARGPLRDAERLVRRQDHQ